MALIFTENIVEQTSDNHFKKPPQNIIQPVFTNWNLLSVQRFNVKSLFKEFLKITISAQSV